MEKSKEELLKLKEEILNLQKEIEALEEDEKEFVLRDYMFEDLIFDKK